jgi:nucleoside diphosphate kinase
MQFYELLLAVILTLIVAAPDIASSSAILAAFSLRRRFAARGLSIMAAKMTKASNTCATS